MTLYAGGGVHPVGSYDSANDSADAPLIVAGDAAAIYESGNLYNVSIDDILGNRVAVRMVLNDVNCAKKELAELRKAAVSPMIAVLLTVFNGLGVGVLAIGVNLFTAAPTRIGLALMVIGALTSVLSSAAPAVIAVVGAWKASSVRAARWG